jgi:hypothetical protein
VRSAAEMTSICIIRLTILLGSINRWVWEQLCAVSCRYIPTWPSQFSSLCFNLPLFWKSSFHSKIKPNISQYSIVSQRNEQNRRPDVVKSWEIQQMK